MNDSGSRPKYEERDLDLKAVLLFALALVVAGVLVHLVAAGMFRYLAGHPPKHSPPSPLASSRQQFSGPRLLVNQAQDMSELHAAEDTVLNHYHWIDRDHGLVRIPIGRAMELLADRETVTNTVQKGQHP